MAIAAKVPAACPICKTTGCKRVVPFTILETEIDFSATIKSSTSLGNITPMGNPKEGIAWKYKLGSSSVP